MPRRLRGTTRLPSRFGSWKPGYYLVTVLFLTVLVPLALMVLVLFVTTLVLFFWGAPYMLTAPKVRAAAAALGCRLFEGALKTMQPGMTETSVAAELEYAARLAGAEAMSFPTIVASGPRSALPHGRATRAKLTKRGFVTLDFGVVLDGYCSDMTRTVYLGLAGAGERDAYDAVLEAQETAVAAVRAGVTAGEVDEAARGVLRRTGLDKWFTHSTGHGVGLEIHEGPRLAAKQKQKLEAGMVVTIEPGAYVPGKFGVRIEDMVLVTRSGGEILTPSTKAWIEL